MQTRRAPPSLAKCHWSADRRVVRMFRMYDDLQLVVFARVKPLLALEDPMKLGGHNACQAERTVRPTQDAAHTLASAGVPGSAAYRGEGYRASTAVDEGMLGSSEQQSMDL